MNWHLIRTIYKLKYKKDTLPFAHQYVKNERNKTKFISRIKTILKVSSNISHFIHEHLVMIICDASEELAVVNFIRNEWLDLYRCLLFFVARQGLYVSWEFRKLLIQFSNNGEISSSKSKRMVAGIETLKCIETQDECKRTGIRRRWLRVCYLLLVGGYLTLYLWV